VGGAAVTTHPRDGVLPPLQPAPAELGALGGPLGRDPFDASPDSGALTARLDQLEAGALRMRSARAPARSTRPARRPVPGRARRRGVPLLRQVELPEPCSWLEHWIGDDDRRVLAAFSGLLDGDGPYDAFGFSPDTLRRSFPYFRALYRYYFRVESRGHEHLPTTGPTILAANHGGLFPFDAAMTIVDVALHSDPPRLARSVVDRWAGGLPFVNVLFARLGQVVGTGENCAELLERNQLLLVFPEGRAGSCKRVTERYRLQPFHVGFVEHALRAHAPIVPVAIVGSDDQAPVLYDLRALARRFGLPALPITPTFPWLGPLGLLPYPVRYRIVYGEPLDYHERFGPEAADDAHLVGYLAKQARRSVQKLLDRSRA
jgi:1-acyl-sn-glycerol-3-phosphate acyltransferase